MFKRIIIAILGMFSLSFGLNLLLGSNLGVAPFDTLCAQVSEIIGINFGDATFLVHMIFFIFLIICAFGIFKNIKVNIYELVVSFLSISLLTRIINLFGFLQNIVMNPILLLLLGFIFFSLGLKLMYGPNIIIVPADKFIVTICNAFDIKNGTGKFVFDIALIVTTIVISLIFNTDSKLTLISFILAFATGPMMNLYGFIFDKVGINIDYKLENQQ